MHPRLPRRVRAPGHSPSSRGPEAAPIQPIVDGSSATSAGPVRARWLRRSSLRCRGQSKGQQLITPRRVDLEVPPGGHCYVLPSSYGVTDRGAVDPAIRLVAPELTSRFGIEGEEL